MPALTYRLFSESCVVLCTRGIVARYLSRRLRPARSLCSPASIVTMPAHVHTCRNASSPACQRIGHAKVCHHHDVSSLFKSMSATNPVIIIMLFCWELNSDGLELHCMLGLPKEKALYEGI
eukprot:4812088-Amphidinium_carterae.1